MLVEGKEWAADAAAPIPLAAGARVRVLSVNQASGRLEVGGDFTTIGGLGQRRLASF